MRILDCPAKLALAMMIAVVMSGGAFAADYTIVIDKMIFGPVPAGIHPSDTVVWQNDDIFRHSATARDKSFDIDLPAKTSVRMVAGTPGTFDFFCKFHPGMKGTLVISQ